MRGGSARATCGAEAKEHHQDPDRCQAHSGAVAGSSCLDDETVVVVDHTPGLRLKQALGFCGCWASQTPANDIESLITVVDMPENAPRLCLEGPVEKVYAATRNRLIGSFEPCGDRAPSVCRGLEEGLPHDRHFRGIAVAWPEPVHIKGVALPIARDHVYESCTTICGLKHGRKETGLISNLRQKFVNGIGIRTLVDNRIMQHLIQCVCPLLCAIVSELIARGASHIFALGCIAFRPIG
mmetsp:Transcript_88862/g.171000  ORF Transcript_88862/g.171000 Transcript_88862/m.171000 type:complete len:239 (+) Transcript_88862:346-1062(+)